MDDDDEQVLLLPPSLVLLALKQLSSKEGATIERLGRLMLIIMDILDIPPPFPAPSSVDRLEMTGLTVLLVVTGEEEVVAAVAEEASPSVVVKGRAR